MPQMILRDMRRFSDGLVRAKTLIDELIVWYSEDRAVAKALQDGNLSVGHKDSDVLLKIEFHAPTRNDSGPWWSAFRSSISRFAKTEPNIVDGKRGKKYTWSMTSSREQFTIQVVFQGGGDGLSAGEEGTGVEPSGIQDDPDGVGGSSRDQD